MFEVGPVLLSFKNIIFDGRFMETSSWRKCRIQPQCQDSYRGSCDEEVEGSTGWANPSTLTRDSPPLTWYELRPPGALAVLNAPPTSDI